MPGGDRGFHLGRRIRAVWLFLVCEWGNRGTEEAFWERAKATQAVSELSRVVPQLSGSQAGWGMTGAGAPGHWLHGGGHRGDPWVSQRTGTAWSKLPLPVGNEQPLGGGARRGSPPPHSQAWAGHWGKAGQASSVSLWDTCLRRRLTRESPGGLQALCARSGALSQIRPQGGPRPCFSGSVPWRGRLPCWLPPWSWGGRSPLPSVPPASTLHFPHPAPLQGVPSQSFSGETPVLQRDADRHGTGAPVGGDVVGQGAGAGGPGAGGSSGQGQTQPVKGRKRSGASGAGCGGRAAGRRVGWGRR